MARIAVIAASFCKSDALRRYADQILGPKHDVEFADGRTLAGGELIRALQDVDAAIVVNASDPNVSFQPR